MKGEHRLFNIDLCSSPWGLGTMALSMEHTKKGARYMKGGSGDFSMLEYGANRNDL